MEGETELATAAQEPVAHGYAIVTTTRAKYFGEVTETENGIVIESAFEIKGEIDPNSIAAGYIRGELLAENRRQTLSKSLVESVTEAVDESRVLKMYQTLLPDAKRRAMGEITYKALEAIVSAETTPGMRHTDHMRHTYRD